MTFLRLKRIIEKNYAVIIIVIFIILFLFFDGTGCVRGCVGRRYGQEDSTTVGLDGTNVFLRNLEAVGIGAIDLGDSIDNGTVSDSSVNEIFPALQRKNDSLKAKYRTPKTVSVCRLSADSVTFVTTIHTVQQNTASNEASCDECDIGEPYWPAEDLCGEGL